MSKVGNGIKVGGGCLGLLVVLALSAAPTVFVLWLLYELVMWVVSK